MRLVASPASSWAPSPDTVTIGSPSVSSSISFVRSTARPKQSNPGPRFATVAGTSTRSLTASQAELRGHRLGIGGDDGRTGGERHGPVGGLEGVAGEDAPHGGAGGLEPEQPGGTLDHAVGRVFRIPQPVARDVAGVADRRAVEVRGPAQRVADLERARLL